MFFVWQYNCHLNQLFNREGFIFFFKDLQSERARLSFISTEGLHVWDDVLPPADKGDAASSALKNASEKRPINSKFPTGGGRSGLVLSEPFL